MLSDIVIDTDVLMHADNPEYFDHAEAKSFVEEMLTSETLICIDESEEGAIATEYLEHLPLGGMGALLLQTVAANERISIVSRSVPEAVGRTIRRCVPDKSDHKWLRAGFNSQEHVVASHNTRHLHRNREELRRRIGVAVVSARECRPELS